MNFDWNLFDEGSMVDRKQANLAAMAISTAHLAKNDPDDSLFVQLTARETYIIAAGLNMVKALKGPIRAMYGEDLDNLANKLADAIRAQKGTNEPE